MRITKPPRGVQFLALIYLGIAISLPFQLVWIYQLSWDNSFGGLTHMSLGNWLVFVMALVLSYQLYTYSHRALILMPLTFALVALNNWWVSHIDSTYSSLETLIASGLLLASHSALLLPQNLTSLKKGSHKPWRQAPRFQLSYTTTVLPPLGPALMLQSRDVSLSGIFLCGRRIQAPKGAQQVSNLDHIQVGSEVNLKVQIDQLRTLRIRALVVRKPEECGTDCPAGIALKFQEMSRETKRQLRSQLH